MQKVDLRDIANGSIVANVEYPAPGRPWMEIESGEILYNNLCSFLMPAKWIGGKNLKIAIYSNNNAKSENKPAKCRHFIFTINFTHTHTFTYPHHVLYVATWVWVPVHVTPPIKHSQQRSLGFSNCHLRPLNAAAMKVGSMSSWCRVATCYMSHTHEHIRAHIIFH